MAVSRRVDEKTVTLWASFFKCDSCEGTDMHCASIQVTRAPRHFTWTRGANARRRRSRSTSTHFRGARACRVTFAGCRHGSRSSARRSQRLEVWFMAAAADLASNGRRIYIQVRGKNNFRPSGRKSFPGGGVRAKKSSRAVRRAIFHAISGHLEVFGLAKIWCPRAAEPSANP